jgi:hypothetical protein
VAASRWRYAPSLNFYRLAHRAERVSPVADDWAPGEWDYDFFVLEPGPDVEATRAVATPVYVHPVSGAVLLVNDTRLSPGGREGDADP